MNQGDEDARGLAGDAMRRLIFGVGILFVVVCFAIAYALSGAAV
jgi:hypothetical protein